jgi:hypothetical protein
MGDIVGVMNNATTSWAIPAEKDYYTNGQWRIRYSAENKAWEAKKKVSKDDGTKVYRYQFSASTLKAAKQEAEARS